MSDSSKNVYVVLHNVHAVSKVIETAQIVYGLGFRNFVVSKAEGSAAHAGVPEANRFAMKMKRNFMVLPDLQDVLEILETDRPFLIVSPKLTKDRIVMKEIHQKATSGARLVIVVTGSNSSFSRKEMDLGECRSLDSEIDIGPAGTAAIILNHIRASGDSLSA
ncbi:MAG: RecB-family nuclease [Candidatus Thorarchaeota archaeon]